MLFTADIQNNERSRSYVYFVAESRGTAANQLDRFLRKHSIDPNTVKRFGWSFDTFLGTWQLTDRQELDAEFYSARSSA